MAVWLGACEQLLQRRRSFESLETLRRWKVGTGLCTSSGTYLKTYPEFQSLFFHWDCPHVAAGIFHFLYSKHKEHFFFFFKTRLSWNLLLWAFAELVRTQFPRLLTSAMAAVFFISAPVFFLPETFDVTRAWRHICAGVVSQESFPTTLSL